MKTYLEYIIEESEIASIPAGPLGQQGQPQPKQDVLKNPALMHNNYTDAFAAAQKQLAGKTDPNTRIYVMTYKYSQEEQLKRFVVIDNKALVSQEPRWENKGYSIVGWVSPTDGVVIKTDDDRFVKKGNT